MTAHSAGLVERLRATTLSDDDIAVIEAALAAPAADGVLVDDAMVRRAIRRYMELEPDDAMHAGIGEECEASQSFMRELLIAAHAAAPHAQGEGEGA